MANSSEVHNHVSIGVETDEIETLSMSFAEVTPSLGHHGLRHTAPRSIKPNESLKGNLFTFIVDTSERCPEQKRRNISQTRSHVMRAIRKRKQEEKSRLESADSALNPPTSGIELLDTSSIDQSSSDPSETSNSSDEQALVNAVWAGNVRNNIFSIAASRISIMERDINILNGHSTNSPYLDVLIDNIVHFIWGKFWPGQRWGIPSPLAKEWWPVFCNVPAVFHAMLYGAAVFYDDLRVSTNLSQSTPILRHKILAYQELRKALAQIEGAPASDELILAMTYLGFDNNRNVGKLSEQEPQSPFNRPQPFRHILWNRHYAYPKENIHITNSTRLIDLKGGLEGRYYTLAKTVFLNDLQIAGVKLERPHYPNWDIPEIMRDVNDPMVNMLPDEAVTIQGTGFSNLIHLGLPIELLHAVQDSSNVSVQFEHYGSGTLKNGDLQSLFSQKNRQHHALLSLPPASAPELELEKKAKALYDCVRLAALLYSSCTLFPLPASTGAVQRLVTMLKTAIEDMPLEIVLDGAASMLAWALFLGAIASEIVTDEGVQSWYLQRLKSVLQLIGGKSWAEVKQLLTSFLWMEEACDEGAMRVWERLNKTER